jgi:hypothetical protein
MCVALPLFLVIGAIVVPVPFILSDSCLGVESTMLSAVNTQVNMNKLNAICFAWLCFVGNYFFTFGFCFRQLNSNGSFEFLLGVSDNFSLEFDVVDDVTGSLNHFGTNKSANRYCFLLFASLYYCLV